MVIGKELQLRDYMEGYRFQASCKGCGYGWYVTPADIAALARPEEEEDPRQWYLDEAARRLTCKRRCGRSEIELIPQKSRRQHHFSGGMP